MESLATLTWEDVKFLAPEIVLSLFTVVLAVCDLFFPKRWNRNIIGWLAIAGLVLAAVFVAVQMGTVYTILGGSYRIDDFGNILKLVFLGATIFVILSSLGSVRSKDVPIKGEFYYLMLPAALGAMVMSSSGDLITLYVGLELLGISTYVLAAMRKRSSQSGEAAFKYLVTGSVASAFILYGMSFIYGITGTTNLSLNSGINSALSDFTALLYVAFFLMTAGFAMKLALAPFHAWAADVYQGTPTPVTSFLAVVSKGAAFAMLYRIYMNLPFFLNDQDVRSDLYTALAVLAAAAMIVGTAGALRERNAKRLLALSGVANAGILLIPLALTMTPVHASLFSEFVYYLIAYVFMNIGAFAVITVIAGHTGDETLQGFAGLYYRAPWTAAAMTVLICSLAGLPITGGFFGKLFILFGSVQSKAYWLAAILLVTTIVSYAVYFSFIRQMYMRSGDTDEPVRVPGPAGLSIWLCTAATLALGFLPMPIMEWIDGLFTIGQDFLAR
jgi:NADH-quinone oxidoreductase subunit N